MCYEDLIVGLRYSNDAILGEYSLKECIILKDWMTQIKRNIQRFMIGRYGTDELSMFLIRAALVCMIIAMLPKFNRISLLGWTLLVIGIYRSCSKKITARGRERDWYLKRVAKIRPLIQPKINIVKRMWADRKTHRYFKCKNCKSWVRVPKGKGKIEISCTKCRTKMIKRT